MDLRAAFPVTFKESIVDRQLVPGAVLYLEVTFPEDRNTKNKFLVLVAAIDDDLLLFPINSNVNPFVEKNPALRRCQIRIDQDEHQFLAYDSFIACQKTLTLPKEAVAAELVAGTALYHGVVSENIRQSILGSIRTSPPTLSAFHRNAIIAALS